MPSGLASSATLGFEGTREETLAFWEVGAGFWHSGGPPWRPSAGDVEAYRRLAGPSLGGRVLVLGVTPELRDLVAEAGGRAHVLDVSPAMHAAANALLRRADTSNETWIRDDWSNASALADQFDLVLGDMVWWAVSVSKQHALRDAIHTALAPDGLLVSRFRFTDPARADESAESVFRRYVRRLDGSPADEQVLRGALYSWLYDHTADDECKRLDQDRARALVLHIAAMPEFSPYKAYLDSFADRLHGPNWTSQSRADLLEIVCARFDLEQEEQALDYDAEFYPVVALTPC